MNFIRLLTNSLVNMTSHTSLIPPTHKITEDCKEHTENVNHERARNKHFSKKTLVFIIFI